jgi:hypothetical protein
MTNIPFTIVVEIKNNSREFSRANQSLVMVSDLFVPIGCKPTVRRAGRSGSEKPIQHCIHKDTVEFQNTKMGR